MIGFPNDPNGLGAPKVDQQTANRIALIKVFTPAVVAIGLCAAMIALAWHYGDGYGQIVQQQFPLIVGACLATLGVLRITDVIGSVLQTKFTGAPNTVPPSGPEIPAPPINSTNGTLPPAAPVAAPIAAPAPQPPTIA